MNPYDFVRIDWTQEPVRRPPAGHDKFSGVSGRLEGRITTESPLFIPAAKSGQAGPPSQQFATDGAGRAIIPGSSLKGLIRSLVETIAPGCWWLFDGFYRDRVNYSRRLPRPFHPCQQWNNLCPACRMFGLISRNTLLKGHVHFDDARCADPPRYSGPVYTPILDAPKPRHAAWYLADSGELAGRKFYFHQPEPNFWRELKTSRSGVALNRRIEPVEPGAVFTFTAAFDNLNAQDELPLLLYALTLETDMRHQIGYAKPAGLGSIHIELTQVEVIDYAVRYRSTGQGGATIYKEVDNSLADYLAGQTRPYTADQSSITLQDLRRIWHWPPHPATAYQYPSWQWFRDNPQTPISDTDL